MILYERIKIWLLKCRRCFLNQSIVSICALAALLSALPAKADSFSMLFGYTESVQTNIEAFPQWVALMDSPRNHQAFETDTWLQFLADVSELTPTVQLDAVNKFINRNDYVGDQKNYGRQDHWATPEELQNNGGDCEDFAISKLFALLHLGWSPESLRLVVVQDTQLKLPHAVLAVATEEKVWILDNQSRIIKPEQTIDHYVPIYSISGMQWWLHTPQDLNMAAVSLNSAKAPASK
jgi:predicted transglutaminase-like cysteine proteinase